MIIVVEGISAAGKTTWCRQHVADYLVRESYPEKRPDRRAGPGDAARLWTEWNARRWSDAVRMEQEKGMAVCDTDPLKLYFIWGMWQIGEAPESHWTAQLKFTRQAIFDQRLGFADRYLFKRVTHQIAQDQRDQDVFKPRPNFGLHLRLHSSLVRWYEAIAEIMPDRLVWDLPQALPQIDSTASIHRYDLPLFDRFISALPAPSRQS